MQTYNTTDLDNRQLVLDSEQAHKQGIITKESFEKIKLHYPVHLYTPNFFISIALSLLTLVCALFSCFLFFLLLNPSGSDADQVIVFLLLLICYGVLEVMVKSKLFFNAGVDNTLQVFSVILAASLFSFMHFEGQDVVISGIVFICATWLCVRFVDSFMALVGFCAVIVLLYLAGKYSGLPLYIPFIVLATCTLTYLLQSRLKQKHRFRFYKKCLYVIRVAALVFAYEACNVYVVTEGSKAMFDQRVGAGVFYTTACWVLSFLIPIVYLLYGFINKSTLLLRCGFFALIATLITVHYYFNLMPAEVFLITGGLALAAVGYIALKYFKTARHGFTAKSVTGLHKDLISLETIINIQMAQTKSPANSGVQFGGGSSGGAGASGNW